MPQKISEGKAKLAPGGDSAALLALRARLQPYLRHKPECEIAKGKAVVYAEPVKFRDGFVSDHRKDASWPNPITADLTRTSSRQSECTCGLDQALAAPQEPT